MHTGKLPVNVKFLVEGEEEIGSPSLGDFIRSHRDLLRCDFAFNPDSGILAPDVPTITYALRGLAYFEVRSRARPRPPLRCVRGLDAQPGPGPMRSGRRHARRGGRVTFPGFYDKVRSLDAEERAELARLPVGDDFYLKETGAPGLWGEAGYTSTERVGARPTLEVCGILSGYTGPGSKTVLPSKAMAKISCRLVPDQDPLEVYTQLRAYLDAHVPPTVKYELEDMVSGQASISDRQSPWVHAIEKAMQSVWGVRPVFKNARVAACR